MSESKFDPLLGRPRTVDEKVIERIVERIISTSAGGSGSSEGGSGTVSDWGDITGTLSDQTDLQSALDAKANDSAVVHDTGDETIAGVKTFSSDPLIPDEVYGAGWNGSLEPPTKNAIYDKIEALGGGGSVDSIVPGNNIDVDATDPANPIVSVETLVAADISDVTSSADELNVLDGIPAGLTATELGYVDGVTSAIQTQLDAKAADADVVHDTGDETIAGVKTFSSDPLIPDEAYGAGWNGSLEPPTKNAVYDKVETLGAGGGQTLVTHIVAASGGTHTTLGAAIADASNGDTIYVREGSYSESAISSALTDLTIIGENPESSILSFTTANLTLSGARVAIKNVRLSFTSGVFTASGADQVIEGCSIIRSGTGIGVSLDGNNGRFVNNRHEMSGSTSRAFLLNGNHWAVTGNIFDAATGTASDTQGTVHVAGDYNTISGNSILVSEASAAYPGGIIYVASGAQFNTISGNTLRQAGTILLVGIRLVGDNSVAIGNTISSVAHGIHVTGNSAIVMGNQIQLNRNSSDVIGLYIDAGRGKYIGNSIESAFTQGIGIEIGTGDDNNMIIGNSILGTSTGINCSAVAQENHIVVGNHIDTSIATPMNNSGLAGQWVGNVGGSLVHEKRTMRMKNTSGGSIALGDVVVWKAVAAGDEVTTTTTAGDDKVFGVAVETINNDAYGRILVHGKTVNLKVDGTTDIAIGDFLTTFTTAKIAAKAAAGDMVFAIALEAYTTDDSNGVIDALLITPRLI